MQQNVEADLQHSLHGKGLHNLSIPNIPSVPNSKALWGFHKMSQRGTSALSYQGLCLHPSSGSQAQCPTDANLGRQVGDGSVSWVPVTHMRDLTPWLLAVALAQSQSLQGSEQ